MSSIVEWCWKVWIIIGLSIFCYLNSLEGELCFDDMFAVLYNGDTSPDTPYQDIWRHDFWGHDIALNQSHKSYRPITITYFRFIRKYSLSVYNQNPNAFLINNTTMKQQQIHPEYIHREKDLQPFHLHFGNMIIHAFNSILVMCLTMLLFAHQTEYNTDLSFISSLLFASHPVHVEAVTGIVGAAELLSCLFGLLSFFCFAFSHSAYFTPSRTNQNDIMLHTAYPSNNFIAFLFWSGISCLFYYLSALSKEGGVTISALMILHVSFQFWQHWIQYHNAKQHTTTSLYFNLLIYLLLFALPIAWLLLYLQLRQYLAGVVMSVGHEVFRRTENPVAFAPEFLTRVLTIPYLHYFYLSLLVIPHPLSVDYSFNCLPMIHSIYDHRNIYWILPYLMIFTVLIWCVIKIYQRVHCDTHWDLIVMFGWMIIPFIPASNLFFFVATFVAERLLYLPSIGFCMLLSYILVRIHRYFKGGKSLLWSVVAVIVSAYVFKTYDRNKDWSNEETLFESAYKVCPNSVKVLQNTAILDRRYMRFDDSLEKLYRAKQIDESFCQADHWIGVTLVNKGQVMQGLEWLKMSLDCKFALKDTLPTLHKLFKMLLEWHPNDPVFTYEWGCILYRLQQKENEHGAYYYLQQSLHQFIIGSIKHLLNESDEDYTEDSTEAPSIFTYRLNVAEKMEDIVHKLSEQNKHGPMDCFYKLGLMIVDYNRIYYHLKKLPMKREFDVDDFYDMDDMVSTPHFTKKQKRKDKKKRIKSMKTKDKRILYKKNLLLCLKRLAEIAWTSIVTEDCKQELENTDITSWQKTWNYMALNIVDATLVIKKNMKSKLSKYYNQTDNEFWDDLSTQFVAMQRVWNELKQSMDHSHLSTQQREILTSTMQSADETDHSHIDCKTELTNRYNFLDEKLKDKSREDHFYALVSLHTQIEKTVAVLKQIVENERCDLKTKMWCLDGLAIILTPYVKREKNEWNFEGLLEDKTLINRIKQTGTGPVVQPTIEMITDLHPYLQNKMQLLKINDFVQGN
eukprot:28136_1